MYLQLRRSPSSSKSTLGSLSIDGVWECHTLEDVVRPTKIYGQTAIPAGRYKVAITFSNRFQRDLPLLLNVPNYEGVRIHPGNTDKDTDGCILVGTTQQQDFIGNSRVAFNALFAKLQAANTAGEEIWIDIK